MTAKAIRSFNRAYTPRIGVLDDSFLGSGRPLGQSRLLFEIGHGDDTGAAVADLRARLGLDSGYLSRLLRGLEHDGLVELSADEADGRRRTARLTERGRSEWCELDRRSERLARQLVAPLTARQRDRLAHALREAEALIALAAIVVDHVDPFGPEAASAQQAYFDELHVRFSAGFDPGDTITADAHHYEPPTGRFLVARTCDGAIAACGALQAVDGETAEIKRMWVAPQWRGLGLGRRLLGDLETHAANAGYARVVLDTNASLTEAIRMYETAGYVAVERYNDNPYAERWFAKVLAPAARLARAEDAGTSSS